MRADSPLPDQHPHFSRWSGAARWALHLFALVMLALQIAALLLFWPIPFLGFNVDMVTGVIVHVDPASASERAGLLPGDRVERIYSYAWRDVDRQLILFPLSWEAVRSIPIRVERTGQFHDLTIAAEPPDIEFQIEKALAFIIGLSCWLTGYLIGLVRRHETAGAPIVAWFWIAVGGLAGSYTFVHTASYPLTVIVQWLLVTTIAPLAVLMHCWFPLRPMDRTAMVRMRRITLWSVVGTNVVAAIALVIWRPSLLMFVDRFSIVMPLVLALSFLLSGIVLVAAFVHASMAHLRRQIRVIALANLLIACSWISLRSVPALVNPDANIPHEWLDLLVVLVPLSYLVGATTRDLYRIDRVVVWLAGHAITILTLIIGLSALATFANLHGPMTSLWLGVGFVVLYQPIRQIGALLIPARLLPGRSYAPLIQAAAQLARTLERPALATTVCHGIEETFGQPPICLYLRDISDTGALTCAYQQRLNLPDELTSSTLIECLSRMPLICESRDLQAELADQVLDTADQELVYQPGIVLWCPLHATNGALQGLLVLGMCNDLDPYRPADLRELERLLHISIMALTNSMTYLEQVEAEQTIRRLYQQLQHARDKVAADIARDIHDDVINIMVRLNIASIEKILQQESDPFTRNELMTVLDGEHTTASILREFCERLNPTGIEEPTGLASVLRTNVAYLQRLWAGQCHFQVEGTAQPIAAPVQREALRILREAMTNAIKHADATEIAITLRYGTPDDTLASLTIKDNGQHYAMIRPKVGAWGVRSMHESARTVGGTLTFQTTPSGGLEVVFRFPVMDPQEYLLLSTTTGVYR